MEIKVGNLSFGYGSKDILKNVSFQANKGEIIGILGENGCGKTTLLKCINALLRPAEGSVLISGLSEGVLNGKTRSLSEDGSAEVLRMEPKEIARSMAAVSQSSFTTFPFTALDAVMMGRYARSGPGESSRRDDLERSYRALKSTNSLEFKDRSVMELSGGEFRRVMIARALAQEPEILLLDEPTLHLDISHQFDLMELAKELAEKMGLLIILVTHDMVFAARYCDKIILMRGGEIVSAGTTAEVMTEENMRDIFHVNTEIRYDERIGGINVMLLSKYPAEREGD